LKGLLIGASMDGLPLSIPDLAEELMQEFEAVLPISTVADTVLRISRTGTQTPAGLADLARQELTLLAAGLHQQ
jgi:hypothetical protein